MKKTMLLILSAVLIITLCSCDAEVKAEKSNEMPAPFEYEGGDENADFYEAYNYHLRNTGSPVDTFAEFLNLPLADFTESWDKTIGKYGKDAPYRTDIMETVNLFSIIIEYDIPNEIVVKALNKSNDLNLGFYEEFGDSDFLKRLYSEKDIEVLCSRDNVKVLEHFASEYSIVVGDKVYTPVWLYYSSLEDYEKAGISAEMLAGKSELYGEFGLTDEARTAFELKLSEVV